MSELELYYSNLYSEENSGHSPELSVLDDLKEFPTLTEELRNLCEGNIEYNECFKVLPGEDPEHGVQNEAQSEVQNVIVVQNEVQNEAEKGAQKEVQNCDPEAELGPASISDSVLLDADPQDSVVTGDSLDIRDNELSEPSQLSQSILSGLGVADDSDSIPDSLADVDMGTVNPRKRSLSEGSSSGSAPSDGAGAVSYASVVKVQVSPPPSQRRRRITPAVNVERSRSRSVSRAIVLDSDDSLVSPNNV